MIQSNQDQGQKQGKQNPGREDDRGMDKGARGTDSEKGAPARSGKNEPNQSGGQRK